MKTKLLSGPAKPAWSGSYSLFTSSCVTLSPSFCCHTLVLFLSCMVITFLAGTGAFSWGSFCLVHSIQGEFPHFQSGWSLNARVLPWSLCLGQTPSSRCVLHHLCSSFTCWTVVFGYDSFPCWYTSSLKGGRFGLRRCSQHLIHSRGSLIYVESINKSKWWKIMKSHSKTGSKKSSQRCYPDRNVE